MKFWFEAEDTAIAMSLAKELGVELHPLGRARQKRFGRGCGPGFGDHIWRVNYELNRIEASFAKPCLESKILKANGFKWSAECGVWHAPNTQENASVCTEAANLTQVESILKRR